MAKHKRRAEQEACRLADRKILIHYGQGYAHRLLERKRNSRGHGQRPERLRFRRAA